VNSPDFETLVNCVANVALLLGVQVPSDERCRAVLEYVLFERGAFRADELGLVTKEEAVFLVMAHVQSELFPETLMEDHGKLWRDPGIMAEFRRGIDGR
jgi:hypothetical protein